MFSVAYCHPPVSLLWATFVRWPELVPLVGKKYRVQKGRVFYRLSLFQLPIETPLKKHFQLVPTFHWRCQLSSTVHEEVGGRGEVRCNGSTEILKHRAGTRKKILQVVNKENSVDTKMGNIFATKGEQKRFFFWLHFAQRAVTDHFGNFDCDTKRFGGQFLSMRFFWCHAAGFLTQ